MAWINDTYKQLLSESSSTRNGKTRISRRKHLENGIDIILSVVRLQGTRELCIRIKNIMKKVNFPKWHGVDITIQKIDEYGEIGSTYIVLVQSETLHHEIFEYIADDIVMRIERLSSVDESLRCLESVLTEWKHFFDANNQDMLTTERAQGLFGELLFLRELINQKGADAIISWAGCNFEQHDFYIGNDAVEVKTTTSKSPYTVEISSEYQLDPCDVEDRLFLRVYPLRKSDSGGKTLPCLVDDIVELLFENQPMKNMFILKLNKYGYNTDKKVEYITGYLVRDKLTYKIVDNFPSIRRNKEPAGVNNIRYSLNTEVCSSFACGDEWA